MYFRRVRDAGLHLLPSLCFTWIHLLWLILFLFPSFCPSSSPPPPCLTTASPSIPASFSLKQKSWLPSYLQLPCSDANHDQQTAGTCISGLFAFPLPPHRSSGSWCCLPAGTFRKRTCFPFALSWQIRTLSPSKFQQLTHLLHVGVFMSCGERETEVWSDLRMESKRCFMLPSGGLQNSSKTRKEQL